MSDPTTPACVEPARDRPAGNPDWVDHLLDAAAHLSKARDALAGRDLNRFMEVNSLAIAAYAVALRPGGPR